ncbi:hypothetical protein TNCV_4675711 [Trichonephila clavipes]|nr:hypothetical protein TNCV_4675711 [Trichonephila clavipes]
MDPRRSLLVLPRRWQKELVLCVPSRKRERPRCSAIKSCYEHGKTIHLSNTHQPGYFRCPYSSLIVGFSLAIRILHRYGALAGHDSLIGENGDSGLFSSEGRATADDSGVI